MRKRLQDVEKGKANTYKTEKGKQKEKKENKNMQK